MCAEIGSESCHGCIDQHLGTSQFSLCNVHGCEKGGQRIRKLQRVYVSGDLQRTFEMLLRQFEFEQVVIDRAERHVGDKKPDRMLYLLRYTKGLLCKLKRAPIVTA